MRDDGEFRLIARLAGRLGPARPAEPAAEVRVGIGDDAAVTVPRGVSATSTEALVEGVHFRRSTASVRSIGRKALAVALSDLAAMGATAGEAYVALGIPEDLDESGCLELYEGLAELAAQHGAAILGGDVTRAPVLMLAVTVVGHARTGDALVGRDGAGADQAIAVTGELGGAAAGLLLLDRPDLGSTLDPAIAAGLTRRQLEPEPRLAAGAALATAGAAAMIDISDGVGADMEQIAAASGVGAVIEVERLPIQAGVAALAAAAGVDPAELAAERGEDYELLAVIPTDRVAGAAEAAYRAGIGLTVVGLTTSGEGVRLRAADRSVRRPSGFDHLDRPEGGGPG